MKDKLENLIAQLKKAWLRFDDVMKKKKDEYIRDSAIQRFEFTFELSWKTMKAYVGEKGLKVFSPKDAIRGAFQLGLLANDPTWLDMTDTRNLTSHIYNEAMAEGIYEKLPAYVPLIKALVEKLAK